MVFRKKEIRQFECFSITKRRENISRTFYNACSQYKNLSEFLLELTLPKNKKGSINLKIYASSMSLLLFQN
ncbi:hypothetical protein CHRYSEO8AT_150217 [Chryseobacterium sp. 8AT]|nr:hypothetical protein CHRYSEO8AT_150217 [Chryseobacterium sp. 8AT]